MRNKSQDNWDNCRNRPGIVLLVTLVLLVVLSILGYTLSSRVAAWRHRNQYIIDYQAARYGCDSAVKYTLAMLEDINTPRLVARPNEPDFSDLFTLTEQDYEEFLAQQPAEKTFDRDRSFSDFGDINEVNYSGRVTDFNDANSFTIRGPYGPPWPFVTKPTEFKIGSVKVMIEVEDENAKYPLGWALLSQKNIQREALAGLETFCEWMDVEEEQVDSLKSELKEIGKIKLFKLDFKPIKTIEKRTTEEKKTRKSRSRRGRRASRRRRKRPTRKTIPVTVQIARQTADFTKLFHSSLIDTEALARPTIISERRKESALKYMGTWGSRKVNINTAPRHVLEAAFVFGGDAKEIAEEIIQRRRIEPFKDIKDLKQALFTYSDSIEKCEKYITMTSRLFTIRVTAVSGVAKASAIVVITRDGKKLERIATISS
jgi:hypothetical protein